MKRKYALNRKELCQVHGGRSSEFEFEGQLFRWVDLNGKPTDPPNGSVGIRPEVRWTSEMKPDGSVLHTGVVLRNL